MSTELEQLARMVGAAGLEPVDTANMLESSLRTSLGGISPDKVKEIEEEIRNSGDAVESPQSKKSPLKKTMTAAAEIKGLVSTASMEKVLVSLYDVRDGMVEAFETCNINSKTATLLSRQINSVASCIRYMGGEIDEFEPLNHVSGLTAPNFFKNAQKVLETTAQCYTLGDVEDAKVLDNGKKIIISFSGKTLDTAYKATGSIISEEWTGNEAIDYIYTPKSGKMSVKAFENGRWIDKSASGKYKIVWELEESDYGTIENPEQSIETEKENLSTTENNSDSEEDIGNPIR